MADIQLTVGYKFEQDLQKQTTELINEINRNSGSLPKIIIGISLDPSANDNLKKEIKSLQSSMSGLEGSSKKTANSVGTLRSELGELTSRTKTFVGTATQASRVTETYRDTANGVTTAIEKQAGANGELETSVRRVTESYKTSEQVTKESTSALKQQASAELQIQKIMSSIEAKQRSVEKAGGNGAAAQIEKLGAFRERFSSILTTFNSDGNYDAFNIALTNLKTEFDATASAAQAYINAQRTSEQLTKESAQTLTKYNTTLAAIKKVLKDYSGAENSSNEKNREAYSKLRQELQDMEDYFWEHETAPEEFAEKVAKSSVALEKNTAIIRENDGAHKTLLGRIGGLASKFTSWLGVSQTIMFTIQSIKKMVSSAIELDSAMTELKKVTDESDATYTRFLENASTRAKNLGVSLSDIVTATADFARLGYGISDAEQLADAATIYKNVGDGISSISEASESIIATMQAFHINASDAMSIVDKFNEVGNNFAITSQGIGEAALRSSAAMYAAGNTLDETIALITAANTTVQNPETVGVTLKTISMYLRAAKTEAEDAGESTDGMAASVSKLREELLSLTGGRVDIQLDENNFKSTYQILKELASVWSELSDISRANITERIGGKRNSNVISALLENFKIAEQALNASATAEGSAIKENEKYLESIQGHLTALNASFQALSGNAVDSGIVKFFIDLAKGSLDAANSAVKLTSTLGGFRAVLTAIIGLLVTTKGGAMWSFITKQAKSITDLGAGLKKTATAFIEARAAGLNFSDSLKYAGTSALSVRGALSLLAVGISTAIGLYSAYHQKLRDEAQANIDSAKAAMEKYDAFADAYIMASQYAEKTELTTAENENLKNAIEQVSNALGSQAGSFDTATGSAKEYLAKLERISQEQREANLTEANKNEKNARDLLADTVDQRFLGSSVNGAMTTINYKQPTDQEGIRALEYVNQLLPEYMRHWRDIQKIGVPALNELEYGSKEYAAAVLDYYYALQKTRDAMANDELAIESDLYQKISRVVSTLSNDVDAYVSALEEQVVAEYEVQHGIPTTVEEYKAMQKAILGNTEYSEGLRDAIAGLMFDDFSGQISGITKTLEESADVVEQVVTIYQQASAAITQTVDEATEAASTFISELNAAQEAIYAQQNGKSVSLATFSSDELKDYRDALEYVNGTMQLNAEKVREIARAKAEEQVATNNQNKALEQTKYLENAKQIEKYRAQIQKLKDAEENAAKSSDKLSARANVIKSAIDVADVQASIDALLTENKTLAETCNQYDLLSSSIQEAVGAYQDWLNSQNASDYGDMASDAVSAIQLIRNTYDEDSDIFGNFGSKKFDAAVNFIVPDSVDPDDVDAIESYMESVRKYLNFSDNGSVQSLDIYKFCEDAVEAGLMVIDEASGDYMVAGGTLMEDFAEGLHLSSGLVQAMFDEMQLKGGEFDWSDEAVKTIGDLAVKATEAAEALRQIDGNDSLQIKIDVSDINDTNEKLNTLDSTVAEMNNVKVKFGVDSSEAEYANSIIQYCVRQKQLLTEPDVMRVDASQVEGDLGNAISLLQQFQEAQNDLELRESLGLDTTKAQSKVDELTEEIQSMNPTYIDLGLKISTASTESIQGTIANLKSDALVGAGVAAEAINGYEPETKTVTYEPNTEALPEEFDPMHVDVIYKPKTDGLPSYLPTIYREVKYYASGAISAAASVNGTAHASGSANVGGNWGVKSGGRTLVGEVGREIIVNPSSGRWYTVGDHGAEFVDVPRGAIVFNHKQTESLLMNGYVAGRASALVNGSALVSGRFRAYNGNRRSTGGSSSSSGGNYNTSNSNNYDNTSDQNSSKIIDWIQIAISRIERAINNLATIATSPFRKLAEKLDATNDELGLMADELDLQQKAYDRYIQQANSVGLSSDLASKVRNGTIDISEYDQDTADLIQNYQEWYEKALAAKDATLELSESIAELYQNKFSDISSDYENELSLLEHLTNTYNNGIQDLETRGYIASTKYYEALRDTEAQNIELRKQELGDLTAAMSEAINSGAIQEGSSAWYEFQKSINDVKEAIQESETAMVDFSNSIREVEWGHFDYLQEQLGYITEEADFLIDLLDNSDLYTDNGQLTANGQAAMGLHGQNYNVMMAQADKYAEELLKINAEIAKDPNNTTLLNRREELLKAQRESILSAEDEKQAIIDMVEEGMNRELDALQKLIDAYTESLDTAKDLYDYQKKVKDQTSEIAALQKQLAAYAGDNSEETRATVQKIKVDLKDAMANLEDTQYDRYINEQKKLLDNLYSEYETVMNERLDNVDLLLQDMIDGINKNASSIGDTIIDEAEKVGYTISESIRSIWTNDGALSAITKYGDSFLAQLTGVNEVISKIAIKTGAMVSESDSRADTSIGNASSTTKVNPPATPSTPNTNPSDSSSSSNGQSKFNEEVKKGVAAAIWIYGNKSGWGEDPERERKLTEKFGAANAKAIQDYINAHAGTGDFERFWINNGRGNLSQYYYSAFKRGGLADYTGIAWLDGTPSNPEMVLNSKDTENFIALKDAMRSIASGDNSIADLFSANGASADVLNQLFKINNPSGMRGVNVGDVTYQVTIPIDHVADYDDFINQMRKDGKFEKLIQSMTVDRLAGGSKLAKNKYQW